MSPRSIANWLREYSISAFGKSTILKAANALDEYASLIERLPGDTQKVIEWHKKSIERLEANRQFIEADEHRLALALCLSQAREIDTLKEGAK
jgi:hypothetical protein